MSRLDGAIQRVREAVQGLPPEPTPALREGFETYVRGGSFGNRVMVERYERTPEGHFQVTGWTPWLPRNGDRLIMAMQSGRNAAYILWNVVIKHDPPDMWSALGVPLDYTDEPVPEGDSPTRMLTSAYTRQLMR